MKCNLCSERTKKRRFDEKSTVESQAYKLVELKLCKYELFFYVVQIKIKKNVL